MPTPDGARRLNVLLPALGSAGDVHPVIALGLGLQARGHRATILTNLLFEPLITQLGLGFLPVGTIEDARAAIADPDLWHPRKGFEVVARRAILPAMPLVYRLIEQHADANTVVASSGIAFGARLAQERHRAAGVASAIRSMLGDRALQARCREQAPRMDPDAAVTRACELVESLKA